ncbi:hypothetical protein BGZ79_002520 [Entomortierella chlamydospora]|nr:hypothetical protein BGZ79_002520 [Entomortierella chlamydospora]
MNKTKFELKEQKDRQQMDATLQEINSFAQSEECGAISESARNKLEITRSWIDYADGMAEERWTKERQRFDAKYGCAATPAETIYGDEKKIARL